MSTAVPLIPDTAPFTPEQRAWLNGFFAGMFSRQPGTGSSPASAPSPALTPLTILFGTQTGTAENLAKRAAKEAGKRNFAATVIDMAQTDLTKLASEKNLLIITSTYGDGEPPDNATALHTALAAASSPPPALSAPLSSLRFSVCSLGDTNYTQFCKCGADFDAFLEKLGATRTTPRTDCDLDYEDKFSAWLNAALTALGSASASAAPAPAPATTEVKSSDSTEPTFSKQNPFPALLLTSRNLSGPDSAKQINHIEFDLTGSGLVYEAGDALGVFAQNCPQHVSEVLVALGCDGEEAVPAPDGSTTSLRRALTELYDLGKPPTDLLAHYGTAGQGGVAVALHHVIDVLAARADVKLAPTDFVRSLRKLQPRLYSISSSPKAHTNHVHLTVGAVRYEATGRPRKGVCSTFLADRAVPRESRVGVFVHSNQAFRPPANGATPMIMVGPGTGIAPFRAFLEERQVTGAKGKNWLFFGDQREATDFIYRDELLAMKAAGTLTRLDLAWSRAQSEKIYVQTRMLEHAAELYAWLEAGAHFYVCGDATRMAKDVDAALHTVVERAGKKSPDEAAAYIAALKTAKRYARDVY